VPLLGHLRDVPPGGLHGASAAYPRASARALDASLDADQAQWAASVAVYGTTSGYGGGFTCGGGCGGGSGAVRDGSSSGRGGGSGGGGSVGGVRGRGRGGDGGGGGSAAAACQHRRRLRSAPRHGRRADFRLGPRRRHRRLLVGPFPPLPTLCWPRASAADSPLSPRRRRRPRLGRREALPTAPAAAVAAEMAAVASAVAVVAGAVAEAVLAALASAMEASVAAAVAVKCATRSRKWIACAARPPSRRLRPPWQRRVAGLWWVRQVDGRASGRISREPPPPPSASRSGQPPAEAPFGEPRTPAAAGAICCRWEAGAYGRPPRESQPAPPFGRPFHPQRKPPHIPAPTNGARAEAPPPPTRRQSIAGSAQQRGRRRGPLLVYGVVRLVCRKRNPAQREIDSFPVYSITPDITSPHVRGNQFASVTINVCNQVRSQSLVLLHVLCLSQGVKIGSHAGGRRMGGGIQSRVRVSHGVDVLHCRSDAVGDTAR